MATLPSNASLTGATTTNAQQKTNFTSMLTFMSDLLGTDSANKPAARTALGALAASDIVGLRASSGYMKIPTSAGTIIVQWSSFNQADAAGASSAWSLTLPTAWTVGMLQGFITPANNIAAGVAASVEGSNTTAMSGFTYSPNSVNRSYRVFAIGY